MVSTVDLYSRVQNTLLGRMHDTVEFTGGDVSQQMCLVLGEVFAHEDHLTGRGVHLLAPKPLNVIAPAHVMHQATPRIVIKVDNPFDAIDFGR
jgi:hypothetical protein